MDTMDAPLRAWIYEQLADIFDGAIPGSRETPQARVWPPPAMADAVTAFRLSLDRAVSAEHLAAEHARLFVNAPGGVAAPPYASFYLDGRLLGPTTARVESAYAAQGLARDPGAGEPADYISSELEFMFFLVRHEIAARATADDAALDAVTAAQRSFVVDHLAAWVPSFIARIRAASPQAPFDAAAALLEALVVEDARDLSKVDSKGSARVTPSRNR
jgi:putative dimethyl sulfoxide reductase chaperone